MIFLLSMALGIVTGAFKNLMAILCVTLLLTLTLAAALISSFAHFNLAEAALAFAGFNVGLIDCLMIAIALKAQRPS